MTPASRSILYVSPLPSESTAFYRLETFRRLGQQVDSFDVQTYTPTGRLTHWLHHRFPVGPLIARVNRDLCNRVADLRPDLVWFEKPLVFTRETLDAIHKTGAKIAFYVQDSPFGPRNDGCWRQFLKVFDMADLHCLLRRADVARYRDWDLPFVETMFSFDPLMQFPPPPGFGEAQRIRDVSYIGHPHEQRPQFLLRLARDHRLPVFVNGNRWTRALNADELPWLTLGGFLAGEHYRSAIWQSKINLSFVTEDNEDDIAHKAVETAACAGFLLALRTPGHQAIFEEDREAVYFSSIEECADKARFYLSRPSLREAIAARGRERAVRGGYDNDTQLARILNHLDGKPD